MTADEVANSEGDLVGVLSDRVAALTAEVTSSRLAALRDHRDTVTSLRAEFEAEFGAIRVSVGEVRLLAEDAARALLTATINDTTATLTRTELETFGRLVAAALAL